MTIEEKVQNAIEELIKESIENCDIEQMIDDAIDTLLQDYK